jgi:hypothetical protein
MSFIRIVRTGLRALRPAFTAPTRNPQPVESAVSLNPGATAWVAKPLGRRVTCESGTLWLCFDGEPLDVVLEPGETHLCAKRSPLSIHALSPGVVRLA